MNIWLLVLAVISGVVWVWSFVWSMTHAARQRQLTKYRATIIAQQAVLAATRPALPSVLPQDGRNAPQSTIPSPSTRKRCDACSEPAVFTEPGEWGGDVYLCAEHLRP